MSEIILNTIFQVKRGNKKDWEKLNPILREGEPGFELDTGKLKIGNGINTWDQLQYINSNLVNIDVDNQSIIIDNIGQISIKGFKEALIGQTLRKKEDGTLEWYTPSVDKKISIQIGEETINEENGNIIFPISKNNKLGVVKGSEQINQIGVNEEGIMSINSITIDKVKPVEGKDLIFNCGNSN